MFTADTGDVHFSFTDILSSFYYDGAEAKFYQAQGRKQSARTGTHHDDLGLSFHIVIYGACELLVLWKFVDVKPYLQIDVDGALTGIDASFQHTNRLDGTCIDSLVLTDEQLDALLIGRLFGQNSDLIFLYHCFIRIKHGRLLLLSVRG